MAIGTAFAALVESLAGNVLMQLVAAIFGKPDFSSLMFTVNGAELKYGAFLTELLNFLLLGLVLFGLVKLMKKAGLGNFRAQGSRECPYCKEFVPRRAQVQVVTADIDPALLDEEDTELIASRTKVAE
ncbi:MscL family protein [Actinokineospora sp.]|uniref:MscL family protein n=1 Tax=Actinokineospora sp. TaxID=1872133 RepID=UPI003D6BCCE5